MLLKLARRLVVFQHSDHFLSLLQARCDPGMVLPPKAERRRIAPQNTEQRIRLHHFFRECRTPLVNDRYLAVDDHGEAVLYHESGCIFPIGRLKSMPCCLTQRIVSGQPFAGRALQSGDALRVDLAQALLQKVAEKVVIAVPVPLVVQGDHKEVRLLQLLQDRFALRSFPQHGITQGSAQALEDGCRQQKSLHFLRLALDHFFQQVFDQKAVAAAKRCNIAFFVGAPG